MKIGFVGCGTIAKAMVEGLRLAADPRPILLSPRNAEIAAGLAARFADVEIAPDNQSVVDGSDLVILAVRPQIARDLVPGLRFRPNQQAISLIAAISLDFLRSAVAPAAVTRAVPLPSVARRQGPTAIYPPDPVAAALFDTLGTAIEVEDAESFATFTAATAIMAAHFAFAGAVTGWMERHGVSQGDSRAFVGALLTGLAGTAAAEPGLSFEALAAEHQTAGGINEQVLKSIVTGGLLDGVGSGLDQVLERLRGAAG